MVGLSLSDRNMRQLLDTLKDESILSQNYALLMRPKEEITDEDLDDINEEAINFLEKFQTGGIKKEQDFSMGVMTMKQRSGRVPMAKKKSSAPARKPSYPSHPSTSNIASPQEQEPPLLASKQSYSNREEDSPSTESLPPQESDYQLQSPPSPPSQIPAPPEECPPEEVYEEEYSNEESFEEEECSLEDSDEESTPPQVRPMAMKSSAPMARKPSVPLRRKSSAPIERKPVGDEGEPRYRYEIRQIIRQVTKLDLDQQEFVMKQLGIKPIWYTDYSEIPQLLKKIIG